MRGHAQFMLPLVTLGEQLGYAAFALSVGIFHGPEIEIEQRVMLIARIIQRQGARERTQ